MPDFNSESPIIKATVWTARLVGIDGSVKSTTLPYASTLASEAQLDSWANAIGQCSNSGLYSYQGAGVSKSIGKADASVFDEQHGNGVRLILNFERKLDNRVFSPGIPAPDAALFDGGVIAKIPDAGDTQGARIKTLVDAYLAAMNESVTVNEQWVYVNGFSSEARPEERRVIPAGNITEPAAGSASEDPGDAPA